MQLKLNRFRLKCIVGFCGLINPLESVRSNVIPKGFRYRDKTGYPTAAFPVRKAAVGVSFKQVVRYKVAVKQPLTVRTISR